MSSAFFKSDNTAFVVSSETRWPNSGPRVNVQGPLVRAVNTLLAWAERSRQRRHLRDLDDHLLADIGLSEADVASEVRKPFWKA